MVWDFPENGKPNKVPKEIAYPDISDYVINSIDNPNMMDFVCFNIDECEGRDQMFWPIRGTQVFFQNNNLRDKKLSKIGRKLISVKAVADICKDYGIQSHCVDNHGSYTCECNDGYMLVEGFCEELNECLTGYHDCDSNAKVHRL